MSNIEDSSINLIITSPPYYDLKDYSSDNNHDLHSQIGSPINYNSYINDLNQVWCECLRVLAPDGKLCINIMPIFISGKDNEFKRRQTKLVISDIENYINSTNSAFLHSLFIWDKRKSSRFSSFGSYPFPPNIFSTFPYEWIIVFSKKGKRPKVSKEIKEKSKLSHEEWSSWAINSIWEMVPARSSEIGHPAPFPEELPRRLIKLFSFYGDKVLDPFVGSGTTVKVAQDEGRIGIGYDINPSYISLASSRVQQGSLF